jgi:hypothetical protein
MATNCIALFKTVQLGDMQWTNNKKTQKDEKKRRIIRALLIIKAAIHATAHAIAGIRQVG